VVFWRLENTRECENGCLRNVPGSATYRQKCYFLEHVNAVF